MIEFGAGDLVFEAALEDRVIDPQVLGQSRLVDRLEPGEKGAGFRDRGLVARQRHIAQLAVAAAIADLGRGHRRIVERPFPDLVAQLAVIVGGGGMRHRSERDAGKGEGGGEVFHECISLLGSFLLRAAARVQ